MFGLPNLGGIDSYAQGINDLGQIVGYSKTDTGEMHAVLWQPVSEPATMLLLGSGLVGLAGFRRKLKK